MILEAVDYKYNAYPKFAFLIKQRAANFEIIWGENKS